MQRHKIAARIILLILSFINFAFAAPLLVRGIREVRVDVAEDVPSDKWWTNTPDRTNTPPSSASSDSDYRLKQDLGPRDSRSPIVLNPSHSSLRSRGSDNSHPSPPPAHNDLPDPMDIDLNAISQPSLSDNSHHSMGSESESHAETSSSEGVTSMFWFPGSVSTPSSSPSSGNSDISLNRLPVPIDDQLPPVLPSDPRTSKRPYSPSDDPNPGPSKRPYVPSDPRPSTWAHSPSNSWPDATSPSAWANPKAPSSSPSHDSNPPQHGNLDQFLNRPLSGSGETEGQPPLATQSDPGPSRRPYSSLDSGRSSLAYPQDLSDPGPSRQPFSPLDAGSPTGPHPPSNPGPLELESEEVFSEVFRGRFKRDISGSRYVNAAY